MLASHSVFELNRSSFFFILDYSCFDLVFFWCFFLQFPRILSRHRTFTCWLFSVKKQNKTKTDAQLVSVTTSTVNILGGKHIHQEITLT